MKEFDYDVTHLVFFSTLQRTSQPRIAAWIATAASSRLRSAARSSLASLVASRNASRLDSWVLNILLMDGHTWPYPPKKWRTDILNIYYYVCKIKNIKKRKKKFNLYTIYQTFSTPGQKKTGWKSYRINIQNQMRFIYMRLSWPLLWHKAWRLKQSLLYRSANFNSVVLYILYDHISFFL